MILSPRYRACLIFLRRLHDHAAVDNNYYKILGISPSASQKEIKTAYFELSKKHHPDRNQGSEESARIFRLVRTAYEVLGSEKKRLQYDKERIFNVMRKPSFTYQADRGDYTDDAERIHFHSRMRRPFRKYSRGRTAYYDFDAWYEGHYGKNSFEVFTFNERRQFKSYSQNVQKPADKKYIYEKIKNALYIIFYLGVILAGLKTTTKPQKR